MIPTFLAKLHQARTNEKFLTAPTRDGICYLAECRVELIYLPTTLFKGLLHQPSAASTVGPTRLPASVFWFLGLSPKMVRTPLLLTNNPIAEERSTRLS